MVEKKDNTSFPERLSNDEQLTIFQKAINKGYSNTVNLFDSIPFYETTQPKNHPGYLIKNFDIDDKASDTHINYTAKIFIGSFLKEAKRGKNKGQQQIITRFPNQTDELIVRFIIKLATEGQSFLSGGHVSVAFSLYQIYEEFKSKKITRSYAEIFESIEILSSSLTDLEWIDEFGKKRSCKASIFSDRRYISPADAPIDYKGKKDLFCVTLHPTVTKAIVDKSFRQLNYDRHMILSFFLTRWLHIKLTQNFTWANHYLDRPFHIALSNIIKNSGVKPYSTINHDIERVEDSIQELVKAKVLDGERTFTERKYASAKRKYTIDAVFNLFPTDSFSKEQKIANKLVKDIKHKTGYSELLEYINQKLIHLDKMTLPRFLLIYVF